MGALILPGALDAHPARIVAGAIVTKRGAREQQSQPARE